MVSAHRRLAAYLKNKKLTDAAFAEIVGVRDSTVCRWRLDDRTPTYPYALRLQELTGIPAGDWFVGGPRRKHPSKTP